MAGPHGLRHLDLWVMVSSPWPLGHELITSTSGSWFQVFIYVIRLKTRLDYNCTEWVMRSVFYLCNMSHVFVKHCTRPRKWVFTGHWSVAKALYPVCNEATTETPLDLGPCRSKWCLARYTFININHLYFDLILNHHNYTYIWPMPSDLATTWQVTTPRDIGSTILSTSVIIIITNNSNIPC